MNVLQEIFAEFFTQGPLTVRGVKEITLPYFRNSIYTFESKENMLLVADDGLLMQFGYSHNTEDGNDEIIPFVETTRIKTIDSSYFAPIDYRLFSIVIIKVACGLNFNLALSC